MLGLLFLATLTVVAGILPSNLPPSIDSVYAVSHNGLAAVEVVFSCPLGPSLLLVGTVLTPFYIPSRHSLRTRA